MNETISLNLGVHHFFSLVLGVFILAHALLVAFGDTSKFAYQKRLRLFLPSYYGVLAAVIFSGILALALKNFTFSLGVFVMIFACVCLIISGAKGFKALKKVRIFRDFSEFKSFMYKKIAADFALLLLAYFSTEL